MQMQSSQTKSSWRDTGVHIFSKDKSLKVNVIDRL